MELTAVVTLLVAVEYFFLAVMVGKSRSEHGISAPSIIGNPAFERVFRVHQNTMEQLIIFFPALWICGYFLHDGLAASLGLVFLAGRLLYARGYIKDPDKRGPGFVIGALALLGLIVGGLIGAVGQLM